MSDPTTPAVKGTQPPMSDPQPQRPVSDPRTIIADMLQVITSARRASIGGMQNVYCPQIHVDRVNEWRNALVDLDEEADRTRRAVSEAPAAPERVRTAPPQEDATSPLDLTLARREGARVDEEWLSNLLAAWDMVGLDLGDSQVSELVDGLAAALGQSRASAALRPSAPSSAPTTPRIVTEPGDWPEDFAYENGQYYSTCRACQQPFKVHKRRVHCKTCASAPTTEEKP